MFFQINSPSLWCVTYFICVGTRFSAVEQLTTLCLPVALSYTVHSRVVA
nr:MAG TPA: hypothetical protein [Caudoviricetes sp.]